MRQGYSDHDRVLMLEEDVDEKDRDFAELKQELRRTNNYLLGLLMTVASGIAVYAATQILESL
jgi:hypothetical protein